MKTRGMLTRIKLWGAFLVCLGLLGNSSIAWSQDVVEGKQWVFLVTGKSMEGIPNEKLQAMQAAHYANFKKLIEAKSLFGVGPVLDPANKLRGIVALNASNPNDVGAMFEEDPIVKGGFMGTEVSTIASMLGDLQPVLDRTKLEELRLVVWDWGKEGSRLKVPSEKSSDKISEVLAEHQRYWQKMKEGGRVGVLCRFTVDSPRFGVAILPAVGDDTLKRWIESDPMVQRELLSYQLLPQYISSGSVRFQ